MDFLGENGIWAIAVWSLFLLIAGFAFGYGKGKARNREGLDRGRLDRPPPTMPVTPAPVPPGPSTLSPEALNRIHEALRAGNKIHAIKMMREATGMGLAEAKTAVEAMER